MNDVFFLAVGILLSLVGVLLAMAMLRQRLACSAEVKAILIAVRKKKISFLRGKTYYEHTPVFEYCVSGRTYRAEADNPTYNAMKYRVGEATVIRYSPQIPERISTGVMLSSLVLALLLMLFGIVLIICFFL